MRPQKVGPGMGRLPARVCRIRIEIVVSGKTGRQYIGRQACARFVLERFLQRHQSPAIERMAVQCCLGKRGSLIVRCVGAIGRSTRLILV